jgi:predicted metal-binding membrane protein
MAFSIEGRGRRLAAAGGPGVTSPPDVLLPWRLAIVGALIALAAVAWWATDLRMAGMDAGPGSDPGALGFYITTWVVMMAAMMFPSIAPMVLMYVGLQRGRRAKGMSAPVGATACFVAGYIALWGLAGFVGYAVLKLGREFDGGFFAWDHAGRWAAAAVLLLAAVYEFTPLKQACLRRCRGPLGFLITEWRDGRAGALRMGIVHGAWCLGCCWALMAALFALGAMSLFWMIVIALLIAAEKMLPWRTIATVGVAVVLVALAIGVAAAPARVPGLTVPDGTGGMDMQGGAMDKGMQGMQDKGMQGMQDKGMQGMQMHKPAMEKSMGGMGTQSP